MNLKKQHNETDGPWQAVLEHFFQPFIELCFPQWAEQMVVQQFVCKLVSSSLFDFKTFISC